MQRALDLAILGRGRVHPNPMVGAVIVRDGLIIGEGWHRKYGEAHAEVNAVNQVADKSLLKEATLYVTLEPCAHHGKTPPCADMVCEAGFRKVVIGVSDPNPLVAGKGISKIRDSGIGIQYGVMEDYCRAINAPFFISHEKKRPFVTLKWAQTSDGFIARKDYTSKWISDPFSRMVAHKLRAEVDAIMVGTQTVLIDNPALTTRLWPGKNPVRIVIDRSLRLSRDLQVFNGDSPTIVLNESVDREEDNIAFHKLTFGPLFIASLMRLLSDRNVRHVLVEGGSKLINSFIKDGIWDRAVIFKSSGEFGEGIAAPLLPGLSAQKKKLIADEILIHENVGSE